MLKNTRLHIVTFNILMILIIGLSVNCTVYAATASNAPQEAAAVEPIESADTGDAAEPAVEEEAAIESSELSGGTSSAMSGGEEGGAEATQSSFSVKPLQISPAGNSGAAVTSIPIAVPTGRKGIQPNLSLNYSSSAKNGWIGVGWNLDMGAIQRNTKRGVDYTADDYVASMNGSASELVPRGDWGTDYYGAEIEGAFSKYYKDPSGGWVVTTKDETKYYYGTTADSRQDDPADPNDVFKWCLDRVEDTNGNYMTVSYTKDQGQIYLDRIDYTGNTVGLGTLNYVQLYLEDRDDITVKYVPGFKVKTEKRLKTIEVSTGQYPNGSIIRAYNLTYDADQYTSGIYEYSPSTGRSLLGSVQMFGNDASIENGAVADGSSQPATVVAWQYPNETFETTEIITNEFDMTAEDWVAENHNLITGDFNGDGNTDIILRGDDSGDHTYLLMADGTGGFIDKEDISNSYNMYISWWHDRSHTTGDFNGDGNTDIILTGRSGEKDDDYLLIADGTGGFNPVEYINDAFNMGVGNDCSFDDSKVFAGDFNGDGNTDIILQGPNGQFSSTCLLIADGTGGFNDVQDITYLYGLDQYIWSRHSLVTGDFNGDGSTDIILHRHLVYDDTLLLIADGTGGFKTAEDITDAYGMTPVHWDPDLRVLFTGDFNGDGRTDILLQGVNSDHDTYILIANGKGGFHTTKNISSLYGMSRDHWSASFRSLSTGDFNGDGKTDILLRGVNNDHDTFLLLADGSGGFRTVKDVSGEYGMNSGRWSAELSRFAAGDYNGDGKTDILLQDEFRHYDTFLLLAKEPFDDLMDSVTNGIGGSTTLEYRPSSSYENKLLPFVVNTLSKVTINDGNGNDTITEYFYEGGNFNYADRSFWGFDYVKAVSLYNYNEGNGACSENVDYDCTISETWFENEDFIYKGLPLEQITSSAGNTYTRSLNTYDYTTPYTDVSFPYLDQKDDEVYDGTATPKAVSTLFKYDIYGNITKKSFIGEGGAGTGDERYEYTDYSPYDTVNWIVSLPKDTYVKDSDDTTIKARQWFTYEPNTGNLLTEKAWLDGGTDPISTYTYDSYGNVKTIIDPNENPPTVITYDAANHTFPVMMENPLLQTTTKTYHSVFIDKIETETGPNGNTTTYRYDEFGRILKVISPKDSDTYPTMTYEYPLSSEYGQIGVQEVTVCAAEKHAAEQSGSGDYLCSETYFDGLSRTIKTRSNGPDSKTIAAETLYSDRGIVISESLPYFEGSETARWTNYEYDPIGRVIMATFPDLTYSTSAYMKGTLTFIDPNGPQKIEEKDIYGRLIKVEEYFGVGSPGDPHVLYATTTYDYDVLGNLRFVTDAKDNVTEIRHDTLSRKYWMDDPDMGIWEYNYDANGNLIWQKDAKLQEIEFEYDALNRIEKKIYPDALFIEYKYDEPFSTNYIGRLTTLIDKAGTTKYYYDELGQTVKTIKTIDQTDYTTETVYDALGRTESLKYPDNTIVKYEYGTGGELWKVTDEIGSTVYAEYTGYNALGQYGQVAFSNGVSTTYEYRPDNNRLDSILTNSSTAGDLIDLAYGYDNVGNITGITDAVNTSRTRTYTYDELDRLLEAGSVSYGGNVVYQYDEIGNMTKNCRYGDYFYEDPDHKHAVTSVTSDGQTIDTYAYDANGNMTSGAGRTFSYDYDNRAESITYGGAATISVYDASGQRVKKEVPGSTTTYIGDIYECTNEACTKYIFGGSQRIAKIDSVDTYYYHTDHLGSSSVITDNNGMEEQNIYYYPFGEIKTNTGSNVTDYKFTDQEWDAESGLYYYNARYYDPKLARFISADTIVPSFADPQSLNRYSYVRNNPVMLVDPSGNFFSLVGFAIGAIISGIQSDWDLKATLVGGIIGGISGGVYNGVQGAVAINMSVCSASQATMASLVSGAAGGMAAGATAGGLSAMYYGGDIVQGMLQGAGYGAAGGAAFGAIGGHYGDKWTMERVGMHGLAGGGVNALAGGDFGEGFMYAAGSSALYWQYKAMVGRGPDYGPGENLLDGTYDPNATGDYTPSGKNVFGQNKLLTGNFRKDFRTQSGPLSRVMNLVPGMNATAHFHDAWLDRITFNLATNLGTMIPSAAVAYGSAFGGPLAPIAVPIGSSYQRDDN